MKVAHLRKGALADWINAIAAKKPKKLAAVAVANKLARICWAMLSTGECFRKDTYAKI